jgi:hypothetical protein
MSEQPTPPEQPEAGRRRWLPPFGRRAADTAPGALNDRGLPLGRLILGLVLVGIGVIWLLEALDVVNVSFLAVLPAALIVIGVVLLVAARTGRHSGLIVLGIIITVILTIASSFDIRLRGGVGDRTERPSTLAEVQREYHLSMGQLTLDLRRLPLPAGAQVGITASVGLGQLTVRVPALAPGQPPADVQLVGHAGAGQVSAFGREANGLDATLRYPGGPTTRGGPETIHIFLRLSVGLGQIEVSR